MEAVSGKYWGFCVSNGARYPNKRADNCDTAVLAMIEENPTVNPEDVRCTFQDDLAQVFGIDPETGYARSPWDNVGVQYGLVALNDGVISFDEFIDINQRIGGHDINGQITPERQVGDEQAIRAAYETGQINLTNGGYNDVPVLGIRLWRDGDPFERGDANVDVHDGYHSDILQARLEKYGAGGDNFIQFNYATVGPGRGDDGGPDTPQTAAIGEALTSLDAWMTAIANDASDRPQAEKVLANRPDGLTKTCWAVDGAPFKAPDGPGAVERITDWARCQEIFPHRTDARIAAGGPLTSDVFKCELKAIDAADYSASLSSDQTAQLQATFPNGVCDWSQPGVGFADVMPWVRSRATRSTRRPTS